MRTLRRPGAALAAPGLLLLGALAAPAGARAHGSFAAGQLDLAGGEVFPKIQPFDVGRSAPTLAELGGELFMAWRGNHDQFNLVLGRADLQTGHLEDKITFPEATIAAPALAAFKGSLLVAWTGADRHLRIGQVSFAERRIISLLRFEETSSHGPALAAFPDRVVLGWIGARDRLNLGWVHFGTRKIEDQVTLADTSKTGLALATSGGSLFVAWTGTNGRLAFGYFNGAPHPESNPTWAGRFPDLRETSGQAPALAAPGGTPRLSWTGTDSKHHLNVAAFDLGSQKLTGKVTLAETSDASPSLAAAGGGLAIAWHRTHSGHREIRFHFPGDVPKLCAVAEAPELEVYPRDQRHGVVDLFNVVYPEIVALYGEPLRSVDVAIYKVPGEASMYLSHKAGVPTGALPAILAAALGAPAFALCAAFTEIPDQALFLSRTPGDGLPGFDHHFTHEIIHPFHDPMDFLGWYDRSWIEEGMTEAAAELVALRLAQRGGRDVQGSGINGSPVDNLKHYDVWSYPFNGAWGGNHPGFSVLGGLQFFFGGIAVPPLGDESFANRVLDPNIRYAAAAALWLMLTQSVSTDPANPDFLRRLNEQLDRDGIREMADNSSETLLRAIDKVVGDARIEGLPVREWLLRQALLKGAPAGHDFLFIDVSNPEDLRLNDKGYRPITIYAIAKEDLSNPANPLGHLAIGELPARNCDVEVTIRDAAGRAWVDKERGKTDGDGLYVVQAVVNLPAGPYSIYATADGCDRVHEGPFQSHVPSGLSASTYAIAGGPCLGTVASGACVPGPDPLLRGATVRPREPSFFPGSRPALAVVRAAVDAIVVRPAFSDLDAVDDARGGFTVDTRSSVQVVNPLSFIPFEVELAQALPGGRKNRRAFFKPNPFTRVVWLGTSPDFSLELAPREATVVAGGTAAAVVRFTPNGVRRGELPSCAVFAFPVPGRAPPGVSVELPDGNQPLSLTAPDPAEVPMTVRVGPTTATGIYDLEIKAQGRDNCEATALTAVYRLRVLPAPVVVSVGSVLAGGPATPPAAAIAVTTAAGTEILLTPFDLTVPAGSEIRLRADPQIFADGQLFRFAAWQLDGDPGRRSTDLLLRLPASGNQTVTARYALVGPAPVGPFPIPTVSTWGLCLLGALLAGSALLLLRGRGIP